MYNFIVNAKSGKGNGLKTLKKIVDLCYSKSVDYTMHITGAPKHATKLAESLSQDENNIIVAVGGDGTFHETLNGIVNPAKTRLGFIPSGRGNDFARAAMLSTTPEKAFNDILRGEEIFMDYFTVGDKRCLNVAGTGIDVDVLERVRGRTDKISYLLSLVHCIRHFEPYKISVVNDGVPTNYDCVMIGVCNGIAIGGNMKISPNSKVSDGKLEVVIVTMPEDNNLLKILPKAVKGKHIGMPITTVFSCDEVNIDPHGRKIQLDGEIYENHSFDCKISKGGLRTFKSSTFKI